jgi:hypothetical protein
LFCCCALDCVGFTALTSRHRRRHCFVPGWIAEVRTLCRGIPRRTSLEGGWDRPTIKTADHPSGLLPGARSAARLSRYPPLFDGVGDDGWYGAVVRRVKIVPQIGAQVKGSILKMLFLPSLHPGQSSATWPTGHRASEDRHTNPVATYPASLSSVLVSYVGQVSIPAP